MYDMRNLFPLLGAKHQSLSKRDRRGSPECGGGVSSTVHPGPPQLPPAHPTLPGHHHQGQPQATHLDRLLRDIFSHILCSFIFNYTCMGDAKFMHAVNLNRL